MFAFCERGRIVVGVPLMQSTERMRLLTTEALRIFAGAFRTGPATAPAIALKRLWLRRAAGIGR
ncbi:hypothetical protein AXW67_30840 [Bradyrhizobium neotropicale]|uniref:Uncharacterized protein n=1 Tax=Bradyrhizobium neotropicale TaxID=1497615 RepID=A0A176YMR0_9BRAD|nr:hypothetical protein AXW67_30840 [Bradyrhizobium neotropicale]